MGGVGMEWRECKGGVYGVHGEGMDWGWEGVTLERGDGE